MHPNNLPTIASWPRAGAGVRPCGCKPPSLCPETIAAVGFATHGMVLENSHRVGLGRAGGAGQRIGQVPRCMAADGWRYGQGQGLHGSLVRSILEPTIRSEPFPLWKQLAVNPPYAREASRVAAIVLGYLDGHVLTVSRCHRVGAPSPPLADQNRQLRQSTWRNPFWLSG